MRNVTVKICRKESTHTFYIQYIFPENIAFYGKMWKKYSEAKQVTDNNKMAKIKDVLLIRRNNASIQTSTCSV
jgi:hypothetical protein